MEKIIISFFHMSWNTWPITNNYSKPHNIRTTIGGINLSRYTPRSNIKIHTISQPLRNRRKWYAPTQRAEFYPVATSDPHEGDPSAVYANEIPVGIKWSSPASIVTEVCWDSNPNAYLHFVEGADGTPVAHVLLQATCVHSIEEVQSVTLRPFFVSIDWPRATRNTTL